MGGNITTSIPELKNKFGNVFTKQHEPSKELLNYLFEYRDGALYWKNSRVPARNGTRAGSKCGKRYRQIEINLIHYIEHRIIWVMHFGAIPKGMTIDHRNRDYTDNHIENLRLATGAQQQWNTKKQSNNTSGYKGVYRNQGKWAAQIMVNRKSIFIGHFPTPELAHMAYQRTAREMRGEFAT